MNIILEKLQAIVSLVSKVGLIPLTIKITSHWFSRWVFIIFNRVSPNRVLKMIKGSITGASLAAIVLLLWQNNLYENYAAIVLIILLGGYWVYPQIKLWGMVQTAKKLGACEDDHFLDWRKWPVSAHVRELVDAYQEAHYGEIIVLGTIDNDGRLLEQFGPLPGWVSTSEDHFSSRYRFPLEIVLFNGKVLIRKRFVKNWKNFVSEWYNLKKLGGSINVPSVYQVEEGKKILYKNLIEGSTLRDLITHAGGEILTSQTEKDPTLNALPASKRLEVVLERGTQRLREVVSDEFITALEDQINKAHQHRFANLSLTFGNVMMDRNNSPWLIDFEGSKVYLSVNHPIFRWERDQDRQKFNRIYGRSLLTERDITQKVKMLNRAGAGRYAPVDFGQGYTLGGFWSVDNGTGRWEYFNQKVLKPYIKGKRILDLGSHNGVMPLMMLRDGAREVVGLELDQKMVDHAQEIREIFEWRDMVTYDVTFHVADMRAILDQDFGQFDVVTAFCSLYYLAEEEMSNIVRKAYDLSELIILQAKIDTRQEAEENKAQKSSVTFLQKILVENGFPVVKVFSPKGFSRPLLVGWKSQVNS